MKYKVMSEPDTLAACHTKGIARFGDGELRLAAGGACSSQQAHPKLAAELRDILANEQRCLVGIPNFAATPNRRTWDKYAAAPFAAMYRLKVYASAFITRPDNAPWIDTPAYWDAVRALWQGKDVALVAGEEKSLNAAMLTGARSVKVFTPPRQHAYAQVDAIEESLGVWPGLVLLCLGATATVLAVRLANKGVHALDLGHIGMFMRHAGAYVPIDSLISKGYEKQNRLLHADPRGFGGDGKKHAERVLEFARKVGARSICDYGCGEGTLKRAMVALGWQGFFCEYDPAMSGKDSLPKPAHLVACTDVLEHIEPDRLDNVLRHIWAVAETSAFMAIATRPANKHLPDGRNAHLIIETPQWWVDKLEAVGWTVAERFEKTKEGKAREVWLWLTKPRQGSATATT